MGALISKEDVIEAKPLNVRIDIVPLVLLKQKLIDNLGL